MRWKSHVRFGGRTGETDLPRGGHRALVRSHKANEAVDKVRRAESKIRPELKRSRYVWLKNKANLPSNSVRRWPG